MKVYWLLWRNYAKLVESELKRSTRDLKEYVKSIGHPGSSAELFSKGGTRFAFTWLLMLARRQWNSELLYQSLPYATFCSHRLITLQMLLLAFSRLPSMVPSRARAPASSIAWGSSPEDKRCNIKEPSRRDRTRPDTIYRLQ